MAPSKNKQYKPPRPPPKVTSPPFLPSQGTEMGSPASIFDSLYCSEENWVDGGLDERVAEVGGGGGDEQCLGGSWGLHDGHGGGAQDQDLFWEEEEFVSLSSKEESVLGFFRSVQSDGFLQGARSEAVEWMMKVHSFYGFSALTAVLSVNYLDRFLSKFHCKTDDDERSQQQPWMTQLTAVACLSLAAKVEETQVPLLLDLQVEESWHMFNAKTVRQMELVVLSTLQWRMNPVTPLSFLDHFARRLGLKGHLCREFIRQSELVLLHVVQDPRFLCYLPSAMAAAVMLHVGDSFDPHTRAHYQDQLSGILLGIGMDVVDECLYLVSEIEAQTRTLRRHQSNKRKFGAMTAGHNPGSPCRVVDVCFSCCPSDTDCSSDSWSVQPGGWISSTSEPLPKKSSIHDPKSNPTFDDDDNTSQT